MKELTIRDYNVPVHLDIEKDIQGKKNGLLTFTLRVNAGNVVDYTVVEYVDARTKYGAVTTVLIQELTVTRNLS